MYLRWIRKRNQGPFFVFSQKERFFLWAGLFPTAGLFHTNSDFIFYVLNLFLIILATTGSFRVNDYRVKYY